MTSPESFIIRVTERHSCQSLATGSLLEAFHSCLLFGFSGKEGIEVEKSTATREGEPAAGDQIVAGYAPQKVAAMTITDACICLWIFRRGRHGKGGGNWGKGFGRYGFDLQMKDISSR